MGSIADSFVVKILIGVATAAVWFALSRAASADQLCTAKSAAECALVPASAVGR